MGLTFEMLMLKSTDMSMNKFRLIIEDLWDKIQDGLTLEDIENSLFFILFVRFIILAIRYNLKTSFYITGIGLFAGFLWYRHLLDLISLYDHVLVKFPGFNLNQPKDDLSQFSFIPEEMGMTDSKSEKKPDYHWYNLGQIIYYAVIKGIINPSSSPSGQYYIDPVSMVISKFQEPNNSNMISLYYKLYGDIIPKIYDICSKFWAQLSGVAAYAVITRIGKKYCPYLIRWHWTFLLIISMIEQIFIYFIFRAYYFQAIVLIPELNFEKIAIVNILIGFIGLGHFTLILFGLFHAILGQYFYLPFFVENTELHIGPRPINSIYSGGNTPWQDSESEEKEKNFNDIFSKLWYDWFGGGTQNGWQIKSKFKKFINKIFKKFKK